MSNNIFYFIRHAETQKDSSVPSIRWGLSDAGEKQSQEIAIANTFNTIDIIISSEEEKAYATVKFLAGKLEKNVLRMSEFNEMVRGEKFLSKEEFEKLKREKLEDLDCKKDGGESGREALARFENGIKELDDAYENKTIMIASHGTVLALYFAKLGNTWNDIYTRWSRTGFCAWGRVADGVVERDVTNRDELYK